MWKMCTRGEGKEKKWEMTGRSHFPSLSSLSPSHHSLSQDAIIVSRDCSFTYKIMIVVLLFPNHKMLEMFCHFVLLHRSNTVWSAICFKIITRYTCGFFPRILAIIPATRYTCVLLSRILAFYSHMTIFLQTGIYMRTKKPIYMRYKQACGIWGYRKSSYKRHRIIP